MPKNAEETRAEYPKLEQQFRFPPNLRYQVAIRSFAFDQKSKKLILKSIQFLNRKTASKSGLAYELGDTSDPLFGYMSETPVDRVSISRALERHRTVKSS